MRRLLVILSSIGVVAMVQAAPLQAAPSASVAALQVALRAQGHYVAPIDGLDGPLTQAGLSRLRATTGIAGEQRLGPRTRAALGMLGKPLLGQRELGLGTVGWDVSALEFRLRAFGLPARAVDGRFDAATARALRRFQVRSGLTADGIAGPRTFSALVRATSPGSRPVLTPPATAVHVVRPGESFFSIAALHRTSPLLLAKANGLHLDAVIVPGKRLRLPAGAAASASASSPTAGGQPSPSLGVAGRDAVRASLDRWSARWGVDPKLVRALAWMESGFQQDVVSDAGAIGVMQLLPGTWAWLDALIGTRTPRTYDGNIQAGVRYLRWLLDEFDGNVRLALAGYYQGARAVREKGLYADTKQYVTVIMRLYGTV